MGEPGLKKATQVAILNASATREGQGDTIRVYAGVGNIGWTATATAHATGSLGTAKPVRVELKLENATMVEGKVESGTL